jgi:hypothetical protein
MSDTNYTTFIDNAGRTLFGVKAAETDCTITVKNPVMISVQQQQNGQMAVQLFPLFFAEFIVPKGDDRNSNFTYSKSSIAVGEDFEIDPRIVEQYDKVVNPSLVPAGQPDPVPEGAASESDPEVIKLFDD